MLNLAIPIPDVPGTQDIEIEMSMKGYSQKIKLRYRVELFKWSDCAIDLDNRADCIREVLKDYHEDWIIYNIGKPTKEFVPLTFIHKEDWKHQLQWHLG